MKTVFYFESGKGAGLRAFASDDIDAAKEAILREVGTYDGVELVRWATEQDRAYVRAMGGFAPAGSYEP